MAAKKTALALVENPSAYLPSAQELQEVVEDLGDILSRRVFGVVTIAGGGAGVFKVKEPGAEEPTSGIQEIDCVVLASHLMNVRWGHDYGTRQQGERPICRSMDGETGIEEETGETHRCAECPYNQFGADGARKQCTNKRQLYIMREGDLLPILFALPPSALEAYNNYRILTRVTMRIPLYSLVTRITLKNKTSNNGSEYSTPVFTPIGKLPLDEAKRMEQFAKGIMEAAQRSGIAADDLADEGAAPAQAPAAAANAFVQVDDEDLPFPEQEGF